MEHGRRPAELSEEAQPQPFLKVCIVQSETRRLWRCGSRCQRSCCYDGAPAALCGAEGYEMCLRQQGHSCGLSSCMGTGLAAGICWEELWLSVGKNWSTNLPQGARDACAGTGVAVMPAARHGIGDGVGRGTSGHGHRVPSPTTTTCNPCQCSAATQGAYG